MLFVLCGALRLPVAGIYSRFVLFGILLVGRFYVFERFCDHLVREERADFYAFRWFVTCNDITSVVVLWSVNVCRAASIIALKAYSSYTPGPIDSILGRKHRGDL